MRLVLSQQPAEMVAACGTARIAVVVHHAASGKSLVNLSIQVVTVGQHQECEVPAQLAMDLAREEHHGVTLARPLGVPEHAELAIAVPAVQDGLDGPVDTQELVVPGQDLLRFARRIVKDDEVLQQVHKVRLVTDPPKQGLHVNRTRLLLCQPLPFMEEFVRAAQGADLRVDAVTKDDDRVVMKQVPHGVQVVPVIGLVGNTKIPVNVLQFHEQQRQAIDEPYDIGTPAVQVTPHPKFPHTQEGIVRRFAEVEHPQPLTHPLSLLVAESDLHAVADQTVLLAICGQKRLRRSHGDNLPHSVVIGFPRQTRIQLDQSGAQGPRQNHIPIRRPPQQAVRSEVLVVVSIHRFPAELLLEILSRGLLNEGVFGVG